MQTNENGTIGQMLDPTGQSSYYLRELINSHSNAKHTLVVCMLSTFQNLWQTDQRAGQDNLTLHMSDVFPADLFNLYMLLHSIGEEAR